MRIGQRYDGEAYDVLIALHARRSRRAIVRFKKSYPDRPIVTALTGTDLYRDLKRIKTTQESLEVALRIVALQPKALVELQPHLRRRVRVIYQSVAAVPRGKEVPSRNRRHRTYDVCVIGHLRPVKDPFRAALAARRLPASSRVRVLHLGSAMTVAMERRARIEMKVNPRYRWFGEQPRRRVQNIMARSDLCVLSSRMEGGANVLSEAIVAGVPLLASRIPGSVGILGEDYPGYFAVGDTDGLARLLMRAESDAAFLGRLRAHCRKLVPLFDPAREEASWRRLLAELRTIPERPRDGGRWRAGHCGGGAAPNSSRRSQGGLQVGSEKLTLACLSCARRPNGIMLGRSSSGGDHPIVIPGS